MTSTPESSWSGPAVVRPSMLLDEGERSRVYRGRRDGELLRLAPDVFVRSERWQSARPEARHLLHIDAVWHRAGADEVLSHRSAAVVWGLPLLGDPPALPETLVPPGTRRNSSRTFVRRSSARSLERHTVGGRPVTGLARTVIDVATTRSFEEAVVVADAALRLVATSARADGRGQALARLRAEMVVELGSSPSTRGIARARRVIDFADPGAQLPGESLSRCTMRRIGCPAPVLQYRVQTLSGRTYYLDFAWPEQGIAAEFDGMTKYVEDRYTRGRAALDVLKEEKRREDEVRLELSGYGRWGFPVASRADLLEPLLRRIGLRW